MVAQFSTFARIAETPADGCEHIHTPDKFYQNSTAADGPMMRSRGSFLSGERMY